MFVLLKEFTQGRCPQIFQKSTSHLQILSTRWWYVTCSIPRFCSSGLICGPVIWCFLLGAYELILVAVWKKKLNRNAENIRWHCTTFSHLKFVHPWHKTCTQYFWHTKSEIYPTFLGPMNNESPYKCTHCGPSAEFVRLLVSLLNTCGAAVGVRKYAIHPFLRVYSDHRHRWVLKEARVHLHSLRSVAAAISQTAEGCLFECADGASFGRHLNLHKQVWCRTILIIFTWETEFRRLKVFFLATWHYFSLHLGVTQ